MEIFIISLIWADFTMRIRFSVFVGAISLSSLSIGPAKPLRVECIVFSSEAITLDQRKVF